METTDTTIVSNTANSEICDLKSEIPASVSPATDAVEAKSETLSGSDTEKHSADWYVQQAYDCFCKDAPSETDPVAVIRRHFELNADDTLKARCASEGKTPEGALEFMQEVARQGKGNDCISDSLGLSICMHYFQDVPVDVLDEFEPVLKEAKRKAEAAKRSAEIKAAAAKAKSAAKAKAAKDKTTKKQAKAKDGGTSVASESSSTQNAQKTPSDASEQNPSNESPSKPATPQKPPKPESAQTTLFDALFA